MVERDKVFWDASTYFVILMLLYVTVPPYIHLGTWVTQLKASFDTIVYVAEYSLYFISILTIYYFFKALLSHKNNKKRNKPMFREVSVTPLRNSVVYLLYICVVSYIAVCFYINFPGIKLLWSDRGFASDFSILINDTFKSQFVFYIVASVIVYLSVKNRKNCYLLMLIPFMLMNVLTTDRDYLYQSIMIMIGVFLITKTKIPVVKHFQCSLLLLFLSRL